MKGLSPQLLSNGLVPNTFSHLSADREWRAAYAVPEANLPLMRLCFFGRRVLLGLWSCSWLTCSGIPTAMLADFSETATEALLSLRLREPLSLSVLLLASSLVINWVRIVTVTSVFLLLSIFHWVICDQLCPMFWSFWTSLLICYIPVSGVRNIQCDLHLYIDIEGKLRELEIEVCEQNLESFAKVERLLDSVRDIDS